MFCAHTHLQGTRIRIRGQKCVRMPSAVACLSLYCKGVIADDIQPAMHARGCSFLSGAAQCKAADSEVAASGGRGAPPGWRWSLGLPCPLGSSANTCVLLIFPLALQLCQLASATFIEVETMFSPPPLELSIFIFQELSYDFLKLGGGREEGERRERERRGEGKKKRKKKTRGGSRTSVARWLEAVLKLPALKNLSAKFRPIVSGFPLIPCCN